MSTPFESAQLIVKLFELRRDPVMREARNWFVREFNPDTFADVQAALAGPHNPHLRMVAGYWDMACSFVVHGAIDRQMFIDANPEVFATFAKVHPLLAEIRAMAPQPGFAKNIEQVVMAEPGVEERLEKLRQRFKAMAAATPIAPVIATRT
ncbi:MAG TPA: hypothetical protein VGS57_16610 [Thermoanaerobaculia bacterium]|jgi:hypothetical protein|nr:hypothetical protein [Thermoanaerobaculia bacterium]